MIVKKKNKNRTKKIRKLLHGGLDPQPDECPICLMEFTSEDFTTITYCKHKFHTQCLYDVINHDLEEKKEIVCPACRANLITINLTTNNLPVETNIMEKMAHQLIIKRINEEQINKEEINKEINIFKDIETEIEDQTFIIKYNEMEEQKEKLEKLEIKYINCLKEYDDAIIHDLNQNIPIKLREQILIAQNYKNFTYFKKNNIDLKGTSGGNELYEAVQYVKMADDLFTNENIKTNIISSRITKNLKLATNSYNTYLDKKFNINQRLQVISDKAQASFLQNNKIMGKHIPIEAGKNLRQNSIICINNTKQEIQQLNKTIEEIKLKRIEEYGTFFNVVFEVLPIKKTVTKKSTLKIKSSKRNINAIYSSIRILDPDIPNDQYPYVDKIDRTGNKIVLFPTQLPSGPLPKNMKVSSVEIISKLQQPSIIQSLRHSLRQSTTRR